MPPRRAISGRSGEPRRRFAEELRDLRREKGLSLRQLAEVVGWDYSHFGKMESEESLGGPEVVQALDDFYGLRGLLITLWELARKDPTQFREQYRRYMTFESDAVSLWHYGPSLYPGLLQTEAYARELLEAGGLLGTELEQQVSARMGRQARLTAKDAPTFRAIISEPVLRRPLRDPSAWRDQLTHLLKVSEQPNITVQALPLAIGLHGLDKTDVMFLRLPDSRTVAYTEDDARGHLIEESAAVERLQVRYDRVRDLALSPEESRQFIMRIMEEVPCDPVST
ncbi:helix-turn-helix transcriptional regulator [Streptomyces sp. JJ38]|uniref:helix-turn-helix domain-containing protein n=1 Tax=Streptomyces sp. JJ38 TaxID=2738128 RepID=UPI001C5686EB|nr:helix-turn-helix transcriptional regulator [Streptomyces sp. JJ38]MBW1599723.1 helix-turn-helix domain-containing protein [Streptomyces sp. JJ38]